MESQPRWIREKIGNPVLMSYQIFQIRRAAATNLGSSENQPCPSTEPDSVVKENHARRGKIPKSPSKVAQKQPTQQGNIPLWSSLVEASKTTAPRESFTHFLSSVLGSYVTPPSHAHAAPMKLATSKPTETPKITTSVDQSHNHADSATSPDATTTLPPLSSPSSIPLDVPSIHSVGTRYKQPYKLPDKGHRGLIPVKRSISKVVKSSKGRTVKYVPTGIFESGWGYLWLCS